MLIKRSGRAHTRGKALRWELDCSKESLDLFVMCVAFYTKKIHILLLYLKINLEEKATKVLVVQNYHLIGELVNQL